MMYNLLYLRLFYECVYVGYCRYILSVQCNHISIVPAGYIKKKSPLGPPLLYITCKSPRQREYALKKEAYLRTDD